MNHFDTFLDSGDATIASGAAATGDAGICALRDRGFAMIEGPDALKFLQGQATCDSTRITITQATPGSCCNLKGRIYSSFVAGLAAPEQLLLRMSADVVATTVATLGKYIVFSKAEITNASEAWVVIGLLGAQARPAVANYFGSAPEQQFGVSASEHGLAVQRDQVGEMIECWLEPEHAVEFWQRAVESMPVIDQSNWRLQEIRSGVADVCAATADEFLPQMLNLQITGGVSFSKGCYTGQEVVARMQYRGKVKRRMYRAQACVEPPAPGTAIVDDNGQRCGDVVSAVQLTDGGTELLAVIARDKVASAHCEDGTPLTLLDLPYAVDD